MQYKYVNKENKQKNIGGVVISPFGLYTSNQAILELDILSDGFNFDRYIDGVLNNLSNDNISTNISTVSSDFYIYVDSGTLLDNCSGFSPDSPLKRFSDALNLALKLQTVNNSKIYILVSSGLYHLDEVPYTGTGLGQNIRVIGTEEGIILPKLYISNVNISFDNVECTLVANRSELQLTNSILRVPSVLANHYGKIRDPILSGDYLVPDSMLTWPAVYGYQFYDGIVHGSDLILSGFSMEEFDGFSILAGYNTQGVPTNISGYDRFDTTRTPSQWVEISTLVDKGDGSTLLVSVLRDQNLAAANDVGWRTVRIEDVSPSLPSKYSVEVLLPTTATPREGIYELSLVSCEVVGNDYTLTMHCKYYNAIDNFIVLNYTSSTETLTYNELNVFDSLYNTGNVFETEPDVLYRVIEDKVYAVYLNLISTEVVITRLNLDGSIDTTFGTTGTVAVLLGQDMYQNIYTIDIFKTVTGIATVGLVANNNVHFVALTTTGEVDEQYGLLGRQTVHANIVGYTGSSILSDGRIIFLGFVEAELSYGVGVWCMTPNGLEDWYYEYRFMNLSGIKNPTQYSGLNLLCIDSSDNIYLSTDIDSNIVGATIPFILKISPDGELISQSLTLDSSAPSVDRSGFIELTNELDSIVSTGSGTIYTGRTGLNDTYIVSYIDKFGQMTERTINTTFHNPILLAGINSDEVFIIDSVDGQVSITGNTSSIDISFKFTSTLGYPDNSTITIESATILDNGNIALVTRVGDWSGAKLSIIDSSGKLVSNADINFESGSLPTNTTYIRVKQVIGNRSSAPGLIIFASNVDSDYYWYYQFNSIGTVLQNRDISDLVGGASSLYYFVESAWNKLEVIVRGELNDTIRILNLRTFTYSEIAAYENPSFLGFCSDAFSNIFAITNVGNIYRINRYANRWSEVVWKPEFSNTVIVQNIIHNSVQDTIELLVDDGTSTSKVVSIDTSGYASSDDIDRVVGDSQVAVLVNSSDVSIYDCVVTNLNTINSSIEGTGILLLPASGRARVHSITGDANFIGIALVLGPGNSITIDDISYNNSAVIQNAIVLDIIHLAGDGRPE